jgi:hypothetical protein
MDCFATLAMTILPRTVIPEHRAARSIRIFTVEPPRRNTGMSLRRDSAVPSHALRRRIKPGASLT